MGGLIRSLFGQFSFAHPHIVTRFWKWVCSVGITFVPFFRGFRHQNPTRMIRRIIGYRVGIGPRPSQLTTTGRVHNLRQLFGQFSFDPSHAVIRFWKWICRVGIYLCHFLQVFGPALESDVIREIIVTISHSNLCKSNYIRS